MSNQLKQKLITLLEEQFFTGRDKVTFDYIFEKKLKSEGYRLKRRFTVNLSNGRKGFTDYLVTSNDGQKCAIEVDKASPRERSIRKLNELPDGISGFILLRYGERPSSYIDNGIDIIRATKFK